MKNEDCRHTRKGQRTKLLSVFVVSLFITSAFCTMIAIPVKSETDAQNGFTFADDTDDSEFSDNPGPTPTDEVADFTSSGDPVKALETLNSFLPEEAVEPCGWNADTRTLTLSSIDYHTTCKNSASGLGAAIILPADSTVELITGCRIVVEAKASTFSYIYGLHCNGNLHIITNDYTVEFVLSNLRGEKAVNKFSAGLFIEGELSVSGNQTGRLAVRSGINDCSPTIGVYAKMGLNVKNSEMLISANIGTCLGGQWAFGLYCTIGIFSPSITIDCMDCQKISVRGGLIKTFMDNAKSCGIVTEKMDVIHGKVIAKGGNHFEVDTSIGIEFKSKESSLTGNGTVCATGGNAGVRSIGLYSSSTDSLTINIPELYLSGAFSGEGIFGMDSDIVKMNDTHVNISISNVGTVNSTLGMRCRNIEAVNSTFDISVMGCIHSWCTLTPEGKFTKCKINAVILNSPFDSVVNGNGMVANQLEFHECDVYVKSSDSRFTVQGINVPDGTEGKGWLIIDNSKVHVETGNNVGVGMVECFGITAYNLKVTHSELDVRAGDSDNTIGLRMNGGEAIIEDSKVTVSGGDLIKFKGTNAGGFTCGFQSSNNLMIKNSEVCFYGGKVLNNAGTSVGIDLTSKKEEQTIDITNTKFLADGETKALRPYDSDLCKMSCPEMYGINKNTGLLEKFDIRDIGNYTDIATSNWSEDKKSDSPIDFSIVVIASLLAVIAIIGIVIFWRNRA